MTLSSDLMIAHFLLLFLVLVASPAAAGVLDVSSPSVNERKLNLKTGGAYENDGDGTEEYVYRPELEYGVTRWWETVAEGTLGKVGADSLEYETTTLKNLFRFMNQKDGDTLSAAVRVDYAIAHLDGDADEASGRLLLQYDHGKVSGVTNAIVKREVGSDAAAETRSELRGALRYKANDWFRPAFEYLGDFGSLNHPAPFEDQGHRLGPSATFTVRKGLAVEGGYFAGITSDTPDHSFKMNLSVALN